MFRTEEEEQLDREAEIKFLDEWDGSTDCFGTVAKMLFLGFVLAHSLYHLIAV